MRNQHGANLLPGASVPAACMGRRALTRCCRGRSQRRMRACSPSRPGAVCARVRQLLDGCSGLTLGVQGEGGITHRPFTRALLPPIHSARGAAFPAQPQPSRPAGQPAVAFVEVGNPSGVCS